MTAGSAESVVEGNGFTPPVFRGLASSMRSRMSAVMRSFVHHALILVLTMRIILYNLQENHPWPSPLLT